MKPKKVLNVIGVLVLFFTGCIPSIHGLYTEDDLDFKEILLGSWVDNDENTWEFSTTTNRNYILKYTEGKMMSDDMVNGYFISHLVKLGEHYFLDLYPDDNNQLEMPSLLINTLLPVHIFARVEFYDDEVVVRFFNPDRLKELLEEGSIRIKHEETDELFVLTASTEELQRFVVKYANDEDAFVDSLILKRS